MFDSDHCREQLEAARSAYHDARGDEAGYAAKFDDGIAMALDAVAATDHAVNVLAPEAA